MNRYRFARIALLLSAALPLYFLVAALGTKFGWWDWRTGLLTLIIGWGPGLLALALLVALIALAVTLFRRPRDGWRMAAIAALIPLIAFGYLGYVRSQSAALPPIHDIATDPADPPTLSPELTAARAAAGANPIADLSAPLSAAEAYRDPRFAAVADRSIAELTRKSYPDLAPLRVDRDPRRGARRGAGGACRGWLCRYPDGRCRRADRGGRRELLVRLQGRRHRPRPSRGRGIADRPALDLARRGERSWCQREADPRAVGSDQRAAWLNRRTASAVRWKTVSRQSAA